MSEINLITAQKEMVKNIALGMTYLERTIAADDIEFSMGDDSCVMFAEIAVGIGRAIQNVPHSNIISEESGHIDDGDVRKLTKLQADQAGISCSGTKHVEVISCSNYQSTLHNIQKRSIDACNSRIRAYMPHLLKRCASSIKGYHQRKHNTSQQNIALDLLRDDFFECIFMAKVVYTLEQI